MKALGWVHGVFLRVIFKILGGMQRWARDLFLAAYVATKGWVLAPFWLLFGAWFVRLAMHYHVYLLAALVYVILGTWWFTRKFVRAHRLREALIADRKWREKQLQLTKEMHERMMGNYQTVGRTARRWWFLPRRWSELPAAPPYDPNGEPDMPEGAWASPPAGGGSVIDMGSYEETQAAMLREQAAAVARDTSPQQPRRKTKPGWGTFEQPPGGEPTPEEVGRAVAAAFKELRK